MKRHGARDLRPSLKDECPCPIDTNSHLYGEDCKPSIDRNNADRSEVDAGLYNPCAEEPRRQHVCYFGSSRCERHDKEPSKHWQALEAICVRSCKTLHERREVGVFRAELVRPNTTG